MSTATTKKLPDVVYYRPENYGTYFQFDMGEVPDVGTIDTVDGEFGYHKKDGKLVYDTNGTEFSGHALINMSIKYGN